MAKSRKKIIPLQTASQLEQNKNTKKKKQEPVSEHGISGFIKEELAKVGRMVKRFTTDSEETATKVPQKTTTKTPTKKKTKPSSSKKAKKTSPAKKKKSTTKKTPKKTTSQKSAKTTKQKKTTTSRSTKRKK